MSWMFFSVSSFNKPIENQYDEVLFSGAEGSKIELFLGGFSCF
jgi:hypothetical protein